MARDVDPLGKRTLGILTKADIMDTGTNCLKVLKNDVIKLHHGYIAVKNRSQKDINNKMSIKEALEMEKNFFETSKVYSTLLDKVGTENLSRKLSGLLYNHISTCLPSIENEIEDSLAKTVKELENCGEMLPRDPYMKVEFILQSIKRFSAYYNGLMNGTERRLIFF